MNAQFHSKGRELFFMPFEDEAHAVSAKDERASVVEIDVVRDTTALLARGHKGRSNFERHRKPPGFLTHSSPSSDDGDTQPRRISEALEVARTVKVRRSFEDTLFHESDEKREAAIGPLPTGREFLWKENDPVALGDHVLPLGNVLGQMLREVLGDVRGTVRWLVEADADLVSAAGRHPEPQERVLSDRLRDQQVKVSGSIFLEFKHAHVVEVMGDRSRELVFPFLKNVIDVLDRVGAFGDETGIEGERDEAVQAEEDGDSVYRGAIDRSFLRAAVIAGQALAPRG